MDGAQGSVLESRGAVVGDGALLDPGGGGGRTFPERSKDALAAVGPLSLTVLHNVRHRDQISLDQPRGVGFMLYGVLFWRI